ncbi:MAG: Methylamine utilization protein MauE, partial [Thermoleophilaceae bacterium]|nr:Methylamine utilization protein MauE [Thermoleophilaceae bacterium]
MEASAAGLVLLPAVFAAGGLLIVAGGWKVVRPGPALAALTTAGWRPPRAVVRSVGAVEMALGGALMLEPGPASAAGAAIAYACFALFVMRLLRRAHAGVECGCFGPMSGEVTAYHVWLNSALCAVCALAADVPPPPVSWVGGRTPLSAFALVTGL